MLRVVISQTCRLQGNAFIWLQVGHHAQEDYGEVVGETLRLELRRQA